MEAYKRFVDVYMPKANPTYSLIYLYGLRFVLDNVPLPTNEHIADVMRIMDSDVANAWNYWCKKGLARNTENGIELILDKPKAKISFKEVAKKISEDSRLAWLYGETIKLFGGEISNNDTRVLYWIYDTLKLPAEVILMLITYARSNNRSMNYIEKAAIDWAEQKIDTVEKADQHIKTLSTSKKEKEKVKKKTTNFSNFEQRKTSYSDIEDEYFDSILKDKRA